MNIEFRNNIWQKASWRRTAGTAAFALLLAAGISGCKSADKAPIVNGADANSPDPADANLAPANGSAPTGQPTYVAGTSQAYTPQQSSESYPAGQQAPAPIVRGGNNAYLNESQNPNAANNTQQGYGDTGQAYNSSQDQGYNNGAAEGIVEADQPPPQLAEYDQPPAPADNDLWTPGYWSYANTGYYWVPGAWVSAPYIGALWTPGYWGAYGNRYRWHRGYWGRHIGYYGGINYGWGYVGTGYYGGYWNSNHFYYNRAITHVSPRVVTVYERPVVVNNIRYTSYTNNRVSYNGGRGGINYQPRPFEVAAMHEQHVGPLPEQQQFHQQAQMNRANFYAENHGRPAQAVLPQPVVTRGFAGPAANPNPGETNRGGFGRTGAQPGQNPAFQGNNNAGQTQRLQMEQQHNLQMQEQHNVQAGQQQNLQLQQAQHNNAAAEQQRNLQLQQHNQIEQQRNQLQQHTVEMQRNNALEQQRANENAQRNALTQHNQQLEQQRNQQLDQQRNNIMQQHNAEQQQRNAQIQQQHVQQPQRNFQPQVQPRVEQPRVEQPRVEQHVEQPHVQAQPQHVEQPHFQAQPQHVEQPHVQQAQPHIEQHSAPAAQPQGGHPGGGGGQHPGGHH